LIVTRVFRNFSPNFIMNLISICYCCSHTLIFGNILEYFITFMLILVLYHVLSFSVVNSSSDDLINHPGLNLLHPVMGWWWEWWPSEEAFGLMLVATDHRSNMPVPRTEQGLNINPTNNKPVS
jgi:hypothetical protein